MPPRLKQIAIEGFRSINDQIVIDFPKNQPLELIGENNSGKSNIIRAIELMFGEFHPKFKKLDDYDHHARNPKNPVRIDAEVSDHHTLKSATALILYRYPPPHEIKK